MRTVADRLANANREIREAAVGVDATVAVRRQARRGVEAIDVVLEAVEQHHLARRPRRVPPHPGWISWLEQEGLSIPAHIMGLRHTVQLHGALMDWQDELLDIAFPGRTQLARVDENADREQRRHYI